MIFGEQDPLCNARNRLPLTSGRPAGSTGGSPAAHPPWPACMYACIYVSTHLRIYVSMMIYGSMMIYASIIVYPCIMYPCMNVYALQTVLGLGIVTSAERLGDPFSRHGNGNLPSPKSCNMGSLPCRERFCSIGSIGWRR